MPIYLVVVILGVIEGITEFLPISSTGHLLIAEHWLPGHWSDVFNVVIQGGAVLAVIPLFRDRFNQFIFRLQEPATVDYLGKLIVAFLITCAGGYVITKKHIKLPETLTPVATALLIGGVLFVIVEFLLKNKKSTTYVTWNIAIAVGLGQLVAAAFPGASRSGTTILLSLLMGLSRPAATEFSFLVSIPTMLAASALQIFKAFHHRAADAPPENWGMIIVATIISAIVSFIAVKWLLRYVQSHTFTAFGWYRIAVAAAIFAYLATGHPDIKEEEKPSTTAAPAAQGALVVEAAAAAS
jgi:undecaprenyl-diphosphatase